MKQSSDAPTGTRNPGQLDDRAGTSCHLSTEPVLKISEVAERRAMKILRALSGAGPTGLLPEEISKVANIDVAAVRVRLEKLNGLGLVNRDSGKFFVHHQNLEQFFAMGWSA